MAESIAAAAISLLARMKSLLWSAMMPPWLRSLRHGASNNEYRSRVVLRLFTIDSALCLMRKRQVDIFGLDGQPFRNDAEVQIIVDRTLRCRDIGKRVGRAVGIVRRKNVVDILAMRLGHGLGDVDR